MLKRISNALRKFIAIGTGGPEPHDIKAGLKRVPTHLVLFGGPGLLAAALIPPGPWKWIPAGVMVVQAVRGEWDDVANGEDTVGKAILDGLSQSAGAIVGALL